MRLKLETKLGSKEFNLEKKIVLINSFVFINLVLFCLKSILKQTCFFHYDPYPISHPRDCRDGDTKRGDVGLIKVKKQVDFKIHFR